MNDNSTVALDRHKVSGPSILYIVLSYAGKDVPNSFLKYSPARHYVFSCRVCDTRDVLHTWSYASIIVAIW